MRALLLAIAISTFINELQAQLLTGLFEDQEWIGSANEESQNINSPASSRHYQDIKRSVGLIKRLESKSWELNQFVLINNVRNDRTPFILTSKDVIDMDDEFNAYATLNYELAHGENRGTVADDAFITRVYRIRVKVKYHFENQLLSNDLTSFALLEIIGGEDMSEFLENAYAAGFSISPNITQDPLAFVHHDNRDHKKISKEFTAKLKTRFDASFLGDPVPIRRQVLFQKIINEALASFNAKSINPSFNRKNQFIGDGVIGNDIIPLTAIWHQPSNHNESSPLKQFLDPDETYVTSIPGGYFNDLIPVRANDLKLKLSTPDISTEGHTVSTPGIDPNDPTKLEEGVLEIKPELLFRGINPIQNDWLATLGIKADDIGSARVILSVYHLDTDDLSGNYIKRLLYGGFVNNANSANTFVGEGWDCDNPPQGFEPCNRLRLDVNNMIIDTGQSTEFRPEYFNASIRNVQLNQNGLAIVNPFSESIPIQVELKNIGSSEAKIRAVGYPGEVAINALQLFKPKELEKKFDHIKYEEHRGIQSKNLHIKSTSIFSQGDVKPIRVINSGDNGGYLNIVNPVYKVGPIKTSIKLKGTDVDTQKEEYTDVEPNFVTITIDIHNPKEHAIDYGVWIDYFNTNDLDGVIDVSDEEDVTDYRYGFVADKELHQLENVKRPYVSNHPNEDDDDNFVENEKTKQRISFTFKMPDATEINLNPNKPLTTRLRVGLYKSPIINPSNPEQPISIPQPYGIFTEGEVEDYLIEIVEPNGLEALQSKAKMALDSEVKTSEEEALPPDLDTNNNPNIDDMFETLADFMFVPSMPDSGGFGFDIAAGFSDIGKLPIATSMMFIPIARAFRGSFPGDSNDPIDPNDPDETCPNLDIQNEYPYPDIEPIEQGRWLGWVFYHKLKENAEQIFRLAQNLALNPNYQLPPIFTENPDDRKYWNLLVRFYNIYKNSSTFKGLVQGKLPSKAKLFELIYNQVSQFDILRAAFGENQQAYARTLMGYIAVFANYKEQIVRLRCRFNNGLNLSQNAIRIAVDIFAKVIPKKSKKRAWVHQIKLTNLPNANSLAIISHVTNNTNTSIVGINAMGQLRYTLKIGDVIKTITSDAIDPSALLNKEVNITHRFKEGVMELYLNNFKLAEGTIDGVNEFGYENDTGDNINNFTAFNNGARIGAPIFNFTNPDTNTTPDDGLTMIPLDAKWFGTLYFDDSDPLTDEDILILRSTGSNITVNRQQQQKLSLNAVKDNKGSEISEEALQADPKRVLDFSIFPNPAKDKLNIIVEVQQAGPLSINIFDLGGKQVYEMKEPQISEGHQLITLRNLKLSAGQYVVKVKASNVTKSEQVVFE